MTLYELLRSWGDYGQGILKYCDNIVIDGRRYTHWWTQDSLVCLDDFITEDGDDIVMPAYDSTGKPLGNYVCL